MSKATILKEIIEERRSIFPKDYTDTEISQEVLEEIVILPRLLPITNVLSLGVSKYSKEKKKHSWQQKMQAIYKTVTPEQLF